MEQFRVKNMRALLGDQITGVVIAALSVPLSMGFAMVAGLPPQYGLYGSLLPVLAFSLLTSSPRFVFGVDAAPAALVASMLPALGVAPGSEDAPAVMAGITLLVSAWLLVFWLAGGGRFARFVSEPVLGGCVTGIATVVILSQLPRMFGGTTISGRAPVLLVHLFRERQSFHPLSFAMGAVTIAVILIGRRRVRTSLSVVMMAAGIALTALFHLDRYGVALLGTVPAGLPGPVAVDFARLEHHAEAVFIETLAIALVITAETLVSTRDVARKHGEKVDNQRELLAYAAGNLLAGIVGSSPVVGSLSRTNRANRRGVTSQWMGVAAFGTMGVFLLFAPPLLSLLPVPVLTGIVIASLMSILEYPLAVRLWKIDRPSFFIFAAALGAEMLGLSEGVIVGVVLSFASFTMRATAEPSYFLGCVEGSAGFYDLRQTPHARPIRNTVLYQFNGPLFFASVEDFEEDLEKAVRDDTNLVVVTGISSVDVFAAERLHHVYETLKNRGVALYLAGHASAVNEQLIAYGAEELIHEGAVCQRLTQALSAGGLSAPYPLEREDDERILGSSAALESFTWAYGKYSGPRLEQVAQQLAEDLLSGGSPDPQRLNMVERQVAGEYWSGEDEEAFLSLLEMRLAVATHGIAEKEAEVRELARGLIDRRVHLERQLLSRDASVAQSFIRLRLQREDRFRQSHPEAGELLDELRREYVETLRREEPGLAYLVGELYGPARGGQEPAQ